MVQERIGLRYAKAIMELAIAQQRDKKILDDMLMFRDICRQNRDFVLMLKSPLINNDKKHKIIKALLADKIDSLLLEAFYLIIRKNRANVLTVIGEEFVRLYQRNNNILEVRITSASPLSSDSRTLLLERAQIILNQNHTTHLGNHPSLVLKENIDPSLIGGFVLKVGDLMYDSSFSETLRRLSQEFKSNPYIKN